MTTENTTRGRSTFLLVALIALGLSAPFLTGSVWREVLGEGLFTLILLGAVHALRVRPRRFHIAWTLAAVDLVLVWIDLFRSELAWKVAGASVSILFYGYIIFCLLEYVLASGRMTGDRIQAAVSVYLLFGIIWSFAYGLVEALHPGSFRVSVGTVAGAPVRWHDLFYFSYVTLTTTGYGDVLPVTDQARSLSIAESLTGVLYMAVFVARLVGIERASARRSDPGESG